MAFCSSGETISVANYSVNYPGRSCLPNPNGFAENANGIVSDAVLDSHLSSLMTTVNNSNKPIIDQTASDFSTGSQNLRTLIQNEFCYYYRRYIFALNKLLTDATATNLPADYDATKTNTINLNKKLNHIIQLLQKLLQSRQNTLNNYYGTEVGQNGVQNANDTLNATLTTLQQHSTALENNQLEQTVKSSMIDYTIEKNESSRNLLAVYCFMNIVAVGILYQLYKSSSQ
jgi:hypothetical protein